VCDYLWLCLLCLLKVFCCVCFCVLYVDVGSCGCLWLVCSVVCFCTDLSLSFFCLGFFFAFVKLSCILCEL